MKYLKEYIEKRIEELKEQKERYMDELTYNEDSHPYREMYFETIARINELVDLLSEMNRGDINEW